MIAIRHKSSTGITSSILFAVFVLLVTFLAPTCVVCTSSSTSASTCNDDDNAREEACNNNNNNNNNGSPDFDSIPSLQYNADRNTNNDEQNARKAQDFSEYFSAYGELHHQKDMLTDTHRMDSYYTAITANAGEVFRDKIVVDVGTGSGILAVWAAKAGAKKVYAIEYTDMAHNARKLVEANGVADIVTVIRGTVEGIELPLKEDGLLESGSDSVRVVDVVVSEWMGYVLLRESMLDSVLVARDKYLRRDTGVMFPSHGTVLVVPIRNYEHENEYVRDYENAMDDWHAFVDDTRENYGGVDYSVLTDNFDTEQREYYIYQSEWKELKGSQIMAKPHVLKTLDLMTCTHRDTRGIFGSGANSGTGSSANSSGNVDTNEFDFVLDTTSTSSSKQRAVSVAGLAIWFTADFKTRTDSVAVNPPQLTKSVTLDTGPEQGYTHWGQQAFYFHDPIRIPVSNSNNEKTTKSASAASKKTTSTQKSTSRSSTTTTSTTSSTEYHLKGSVNMFRTKKNARLYKCRIEHFLEETDKETQEVTGKTDPVEAVYSVP